MPVVDRETALFENSEAGKIVFVHFGQDLCGALFMVQEANAFEEELAAQSPSATIGRDIDIGEPSVVGLPNQATCAAVSTRAPFLDIARVISSLRQVRISMASIGVARRISILYPLPRFEDLRMFPRRIGPGQAMLEQIS